MSCGTCVDEFDVSLQISVDHEDFITARMRTRSLPNLLVMFFNVFLNHTNTDFELTADMSDDDDDDEVPSCRQLLYKPLYSPDEDTCRWWAAPLCV